jgi:hypothetical protein
VGGVGLACVVARESEDLGLDVGKRGHAAGGRGGELDDLIVPAAFKGSCKL